MSPMYFFEKIISLPYANSSKSVFPEVSRSSPTTGRKAFFEPSSVFLAYKALTPYLAVLASELSGLATQKLGFETVKIEQKTREIEPNDYLMFTLQFHPLGQEAPFTVELPAFSIPKLDATVAKQVDEIEASGLKWAKANGLYLENKLKVLASTFSSLLVQVTYGGINFSREKMELLDRWMRVLFVNDDAIDHSSAIDSSGSILKTQSGVASGNKRLISLVEEIHNNYTYSFTLHPDTSLVTFEYAADVRQRILAEKGIDLDALSPKEKMTLYVLDGLFRGRSVPSEFSSSLKQYLQSTVREAQQQEQLRWPSATVLRKSKMDSSGSVHAIMLALALDPGTVGKVKLEDFDDKSQVSFVAGLVEKINDVLSHNKEYRQRIKELLEIINTIIEPSFQKSMEAFGSNESTAIQQDSNVQKALLFLQKLSESLKLRDVTLSSDNLVSECLRIIPSNNLIDVLRHDIDTITFEAAYKSVAKEAFENFSEISLPREADISTARSVFYNSLQGWGNQLIWAFVPRYKQNSTVALSAAMLENETLFPKIETA